MTECSQQSFHFAGPGRREVVARFDGGTITSDGGGLCPGAGLIRTASVRPRHVVASHQAMRPSVRFSPLARNPPLVDEPLGQLIASQAPGDSKRRVPSRRGQSPVDPDLMVEQAQ